MVIDLVPASESEAAAQARQAKRAWLAERGYRVLEVLADAAEADRKSTLDRIADAVAASQATGR